MEDAILSISPGIDMEKKKTMVYRSGVVPLTYKSYFFGMTKAADVSDWPSPAWRSRIKGLVKKGEDLVRIYDLLPIKSFR